MIERVDEELDRLVDGELTHEERRALIARLEADPDGWRRCAVAFLEAQAWREAMGEMLAAPSAPIIAKRRRSHPLPRRLTFAAGLLAAFSAGWLAHHAPSVSSPREIVVAPKDPAESGPLAQGDMSPEAAPTMPIEPPPSLADAMVRTWERQGFQVERQERFASIEAGPGRTHTIPVQEVRLLYIGDRTF